MNILKLSLLPVLLWIPFAAKSNPMVELYTSQGCYSCPAADKFLGELIKKRPDVVALEFHVDYWDDLRYGSAGVWKDPFSNPAYSARQRRYNKIELAGKRGVYTPQMIINGRTAQVGSSKGPVMRALDKKMPEVDITASVAENQLTVDIKDKHKSGTTVWLALFDPIHSTAVTHGENHDKTMVNHHVVRELISLGPWQGDEISQTFQLPASAGNHSCAVFLQDESLGQVRGATYCKTI